MNWVNWTGYTWATGWTARWTAGWTAIKGRILYLVTATQPSPRSSEVAWLGDAGTGLVHAPLHLVGSLKPCTHWPAALSRWPPLPLPAHLLPVFSHLSAAHPISFRLCEGSTPPVVNHPESRPLHRAAEAPAYPPARFRRRSFSGQEERGPTTRAHTLDARHSVARPGSWQLGAPPDDNPQRQQTKTTRATNTLRRTPSSRPPDSGG